MSENRAVTVTLEIGKTPSLMRVIVVVYCTKSELQIFVQRVQLKVLRSSVRVFHEEKKVDG